MSAIDKFNSSARGRAGGPHHLELATPSDSTDLPFVTQWIFVTVAGSLRLTMASGAQVTIAQFPAGWHMLEVSRIHATGTTATGIMVGY